MKKILLLNNGYPSKTHPNYVTYIQRIKECLELAGFQVELLVLDSNFRSFWGKYYRFFTYYLNMLLYSKYRSFDFVYVNNYPYSFLPLIIHFGKMKNIVIHWHGDDIFPRTKLSGALNRISYRFVRKGVIHFAPSQYFAQAVARKLGILPDSVHVSPSGGVDIHRFFRNEKNKRRPNLIRLGFASGLLRSKGVGLVINLLQEIETVQRETETSIEFHFIEYGAERKEHAPVLKSFKNTIMHLPYPISNMGDFYNQIDILLFPSQSESLGLVGLEAMACDVPVLATDDFAFRETVVKGITGERFLMDDLNSLKLAVVKCILNIDQYRCREFVVKNYSQEVVALAYLNQLSAGSDTD